MVDREQATVELIEIGRLLYAQGIFQARAGNLSARLADQTVLITRSRTHKGLLTAADFLLIDHSGAALEAGTPSSEALLHLAAYAADPAIQAVGHAHPLYCTELAHRELALEVALAEEGPLVLGTPPMIANEPRQARTAAWQQAVTLGNRAALLSHHGVIVAGTFIEDVLCKLELVEWIATLQCRLLNASSHVCACVYKHSRPTSTP